MKSTIENLEKHFILKASVNAATGLQMAQHLWDYRCDLSDSQSIQEFVHIINAASLSLQTVCKSINYDLHKGKNGD